MFSGIIETTGKITNIIPEGTNIHFILEAPFVSELRIDQSVAHNGICLTVVELFDRAYRVTAIQETLERTNLAAMKTGDEVNLERCLKLGDRVDGHMVQGHVDTTAVCSDVIDNAGSWTYNFLYEATAEYVTVPKGSICINGVSLTVVDSSIGRFSVCIIPYTYEHTNFKNIKPGDKVNLEFDILGKYVMRYLSLNNK